MTIPCIRRPKPIRMPPTSFFLPLLLAIRRTIPTRAKTGAKFAGLQNWINRLSPSSPVRLSIQVVTVVPMLAPIIIGMTCERRISPEFTKPTSITVVADDDCTTAVTRIPRSSPLKRLEVSFSNICSSLPPASFSSLSLIRFIP